MPELPEVETVRMILKKKIVGKTIKNVLVYYEKIIKNANTDEFISLLKKQRLIDIERQGKYLIFIFSDIILLSHLRMEGKYLLQTDGPYTKHEHIIFRFTDNNELRYHDTRKFGTMHIFKTTDFTQVKRLSPLNKLGLEPFDIAMTPEYLAQKTLKLNRSVKSLLLDQSIISGLGNIYADEVLFLSKIHPQTNVKYLGIENFRALIENSRTVLSRAISYGGTTVRSFKASDEISGSFQNYLSVHTKTNCPVCGRDIIKIKIIGRGTYLCENCQKRYDNSNNI